MIDPRTFERLEELDLPPGMHYEVTGAGDAQELVLRTRRPYYRCPSCAVRVMSELTCATCTCGHDITAPWCTVTALHGGNVEPADVLAAADELHGKYRRAVHYQRSQVRSRLRRELSAVLNADRRESTGSETEPGVHQLTDGRWAAWDFDPDGSGDAVRVIQDRDLTARSKRTYLDRIKIERGLTTWAAAGYLRAAKGDLELALTYARLGERNPLVAQAIIDNPPPHLRYRVLTGPPPVGLEAGQEFTHRDVRITPALAQTLLDRYTRSPAQRPLNRRWVRDIIAGLQEPDAVRFETITVASDGTTIAGKHLLHAIVRSGITAAADVEHNAPMPERLEGKGGTPTGLALWARSIY